MSKKQTWFSKITDIILQKHKPQPMQEHYNSDFHVPSVKETTEYISMYQQQIPPEVYKYIMNLLQKCSSSEEFVDKLFTDDFLLDTMSNNNELSDILRFSTLPKNTLSNVQNLQLCKFIKSSDKIAQASQEKWASIQPEIGKIYQSAGRPLCWTDAEHALTFLQYGDKVIYGDTSPTTLAKDGLQNEPVLRGGTDVYTEYLIQKIPIGQIRDLRDIENVKYLLLHAKDTDLVKLFENPQTLNDVIARWKMYGGFKDSIAMLEHIQQATIVTDANELRESIASYDKQPAMYIETPIEPEL